MFFLHCLWISKEQIKCRKWFQAYGNFLQVDGTVAISEELVVLALNLEGDSHDWENNEDFSLFF